MMFPFRGWDKDSTQLVRTKASKQNFLTGQIVPADRPALPLACALACFLV